MIMPNEGGVAGWELDPEQLRRETGPVPEHAVSDDHGAGTGRHGETDDRMNQGDSESGRKGGYGGWRWAARVGQDD